MDEFLIRLVIILVVSGAAAVALIATGFIKIPSSENTEDKKTCNLSSFPYSYGTTPEVGLIEHDEERTFPCSGDGTCDGYDYSATCKDGIWEQTKYCPAKKAFKKSNVKEILLNDNSEYTVGTTSGGGYVRYEKGEKELCMMPGEEAEIICLDGLPKQCGGGEFIVEDGKIVTKDEKSEASCYDCVPEDIEFECRNLGDIVKNFESIFLKVCKEKDGSKDCDCVADTGYYADDSNLYDALQVSWNNYCCGEGREGAACKCTYYDGVETVPILQFADFDACLATSIITNLDFAPTATPTATPSFVPACDCNNVAPPSVCEDTFTMTELVNFLNVLMVPLAANAENYLTALKETKGETICSGTSFYGVDGCGRITADSEDSPDCIDEKAFIRGFQEELWDSFFLKDHCGNFSTSPSPSTPSPTLAPLTEVNQAFCDEARVNFAENMSYADSVSFMFDNLGSIQVLLGESSLATCSFPDNVLNPVSCKAQWCTEYTRQLDENTPNPTVISGINFCEIEDLCFPWGNVNNDYTKDGGWDPDACEDDRGEQCKSYLNLRNWEACAADC